MKDINYEPGRDAHGLPYDPFKSCVVPRPIGWISTRSPAGVDNLAPFSQFTNVSYDPPSILFCAHPTIDGRRKDSVANAEATGEFVWNMATRDLREAVNLTAEECAPEIDEFERAGLEKQASMTVTPPRVAASPVHFECEVIQIITIPGRSPAGTADIVFGKVRLVHIAPWALTDDGRLDVVKIKPIARMGYYDYTSVDSIFTMPPPGDGRAGDRLEGKVR